jgi:hypothetical protein
VAALYSVAAERGGRCLTERYSNSQTRLEWECKRGHQWLASFNSIKQGSWCPECRAAARAERSFSAPVMGIASAD